MPQCLCFHINRTYWQNNGVPYKDDTFVQFSEILNIEQYLYKRMNDAAEIPGIVGLLSDQDGRLSKEGIKTQKRLVQLDNVEATSFSGHLLFATCHPAS